MQRGTCAVSVKVQNAEAAGAEAVIIFNQGNAPDREGLLVGTLDPFVASVPVVGASFADGAALAVNSDAVAYAMLTYAYSTESVNGVPGKPLPGPQTVGGGSAAARGYAGGSSSGLHEHEEAPAK